MEEILKRLDALIAMLDQCLELVVKGRTAYVPVADQWMRSDEVMNHLKISERTLYKYRKKGFFDTRMMGRLVLYSKNSVMRLGNE